jgi:hypothetical protein
MEVEECLIDLDNCIVVEPPPVIWNFPAYLRGLQKIHNSRIYLQLALDIVYPQMINLCFLVRQMSLPEEAIGRLILTNVHWHYRHTVREYYQSSSRASFDVHFNDLLKVQQVTYALRSCKV